MDGGKCTVLNAPRWCDPETDLGSLTDLLDIAESINVIFYVAEIFSW